VQSQHLALSYVEKGPMLAWMIALCDWAFGSSEWAVRLPVWASSLAAAYVAGRVTLSLTMGNQRAALLAVVLFILTPAFSANAQICTQDGVLILVILLLAWAGLALVRRWESRESTWTAWLVFYAIIGLGMLLKQSVPVLMTGVVAYAWVRRKNLPWQWGTLLGQQVAGLLVVLLVMSPVIIDEARTGWPMVAHTLGHLGMGGDQVNRVNSGNPALWLANSLGSLIGAVGPAMIALMVWASWRAAKSQTDRPSRWPGELWLICLAWPSTLFFVLLSLKKPIVPSWPLPHVAPLIPLVACLLAELLPRRRNTTVSHDTTPQRTAEPSPKTIRHAQTLWGITLWYGAVGSLLLMFPTSLTHLPFVGKTLDTKVFSRMHQSRDLAENVHRDAEAVKLELGEQPIIVANHYMTASLLSFYLPPRYTVTAAAGFVSDRLSNFDRWDSTRINNPAFHGKPLLLVGEKAKTWNGGLIFDSLTQRPTGNFLGLNYQGPRNSRIDQRRNGDSD
jgi:4-amino-4-deoxy-L-arabinose transferase-like glycosyltransferase